MSDDEVLARWSVADLDLLHEAVGIGEEWRESDRRAELVTIEETR